MTTAEDVKILWQFTSYQPDDVKHYATYSVDSEAPEGWQDDPDHKPLYLMRQTSVMSFHIQFPEGNHYINFYLDRPDWRRALSKVTMTPQLPWRNLQQVGEGSVSLNNPLRVNFEIINEPPWIIPERVYEEEISTIQIGGVTIRLPSYLSDLNVYLQQAKSNLESTLNYVVPAFQQFLAPLSVIGNFFKDPFGMLINRFRDIIGVGGKDYAEETVQSFLDVVKGSPDWSTLLLENQDPITSWALGQIPRDLDVSTWIPEKPTNEAYIDRSFALASTLLSHNINANLLGMVGELVSWGQVEGLTNLMNTVIANLGVNDIVKAINLLPIEKGMLKPYEYAINSAFPNEIPPYTDLSEMVVKEVITPEQFFKAVRKLGFSTEWSQRIYDKRFNPPSYGEIIKAYFRGTMSQEELLEMLKRVELDPRYNEQVWLPNIENIPPYTDLIRLRTREVISQSVFQQYLRWWGYDPVWSGRLWTGHFIPPTLGDILISFRRQNPVRIPFFNEETGERQLSEAKPLDVASVHKLMELVDLDPDYIDIYNERLYIDPSARMGRWMFEVGAIDVERLQEIVHRAGYKPDDEALMVEMLRTFQVRRFRNRYVTQLLSAYVQDAINEEELRETLESERFVSEVGDYIVKIGDIRKRTEETPEATFKPKLLSLGDLKKAFMLDKLDRSNLSFRLLQRGYNSDDVTIMIEILESDKIATDEGGRTMGLTIAQLLQGWRYGQLEEDELRTRLQLRGMDTREINILIETKRKQWDVGGVVA